MSPKVTPANMRRLASQSELLNAAQGVGTIFVVGPTFRAAQNLGINLKTSLPKARMVTVCWRNAVNTMLGRMNPVIVISTTQELPDEMDALIRAHGWGFVHYDLSA